MGNRPHRRPDGFQVTAADQSRPLTPNTLNTFTTSVPVKAGDLLGLNRGVGGSGCGIPGGTGGTTRSLFPADLAVGSSATFTTSSTRRLNIAATVEPLSTITVGSVTRNKKKGTARLTVTVPNAGELALGGKGVKAGKATAAAAGDVRLTIRPKGKKKRTLNDTGKVKVTPEITFKPTNGQAKTQSTKVKLKRN